MGRAKTTGVSSKPKPPQLWYAISIKQPWAALIVHGVKTIEIRSWPASRRGTVLIHASKSPVDDIAVWKLVKSEEIAATAKLVGGVIGRVELADCITYRTREEYAADAGRHCTGPEWFHPIRYGFVLAKPKRLAFIPWPGNTNFFTVTATLKPLRTRKVKAAGNPYIIRLPEDIKP